MSTPRTPVRTTQQSNRYSFLFWGVVTCLLIVACTGESSPSTTTDQPAPAPSTTTSTTAAPTTTTTLQADEFAEHVAAIEQMVASRNSGDFEAWLAHFVPVQPLIFGSTIRQGSDLDWQRSFMAAGEVWSITGECRELITGSVECPMKLKNEFHGPAGIWFDVPALRFSFAEDGLISGLGADSWQIAGDPGEYNRAFDTWLEEAHPDIHASFGPRVEGEDGLPSAEDMPVALEYVDEFLAQSDTYPIGEAATADLAPVVEPLGRATFVSEVSGELSTFVDGAQSTGSEFADASDIVFAKITIPAGGTAPWHSHTGPALLLNTGPGTLTSAITVDCLVQVIDPGQAFLDPGDGVPHVAVNASGEDVVLYAMFLGVIENPVVGTEQPDRCELSG